VQFSASNSSVLNQDEHNYTDVNCSFGETIHMRHMPAAGYLSCHRVVAERVLYACTGVMHSLCLAHYSKHCGLVNEGRYAQYQLPWVHNFNGCHSSANCKHGTCRCFWRSKCYCALIAFTRSLLRRKLSLLRAVHPFGDSLAVWFVMMQMLCKVMCR
jgi:hypothetical protein